MPVEDFIENTISYFYCHNQMKHKHFVGIILLSLASHHIKELSLIGSFFFFANRIENQSRDESCGTRSSLYSHLASNLPCTKETLLKRAKKLRLMAHDSCLKEPLQKLKEGQKLHVLET